MKLGIGIGIAALLASCGAEEVPTPRALTTYCVEVCPWPEDGIGAERCIGAFTGSPCVREVLSNGCRLEPRTQVAPPRCSGEGPMYCVQTCPQHDGECWRGNGQCSVNWIGDPGCGLLSVRRTTPPRFDCRPDAGAGGGDGGLDAGTADR